MGEIPAFLLAHECRIEPYLDWGIYGPPIDYPCLVDEALASAGPAGTERIAQITIVGPLDPVVPDGSRITLTDGRKGYASAVARHIGAADWPTPDHQQIAVQTARAYGPAFGETVVILYRNVSRDAAGATLTTWYRQPVDGAAVRILTSSEAAVGTAETATDAVEIILPPGTPISSRDRMEVRGLAYDVDGTPTEVTDPQTTARPGVRVIGKRRQA